MLIDDLQRLEIFSGLPDEQLAELIERSAEVPFEPGDVLWHGGAPADYWWVLVEGTIDLVRNVGGEETILGGFHTPGRWAGGFKAWDATGTYLATGRATSAGRFLRVPAPVLREMIMGYPIVAHLIEGLFRTARSIDAGARQRDALATLGRLSAGLAHEINNPASAAVRAVESLERANEGLLRSLTQLADVGMTAGQFAALDSLRRGLQPPSAPLPALERADLEEEIGDWLEDHDVASAWSLAPDLVVAGVDLPWLERAAAVLDPHPLGPALEWVGATVATQALLEQIRDSTQRVSSLVAAVKSYSQMGRAAMQPVPLADGLESTLVMLGHLLREGITVVRDYRDQPVVDAYAGELNQVWTNLIDNAVDAMSGEGTLRLVLTSDADHGIVEVHDSGTGMPPDVVEHAFDAFFSTKDVGKGTGLGLDIARRIVVQRHGGTIDIESEPGHTVVRVRVPKQAQR